MSDQVRDRIRGLLLKVGDERKKAVGNIKGLASVLQEDITDHRDSIMISLIECGKYLPTKSGIYGTWLALMNPNNRVFVADTVNGLYSELRYSVADHNLQVSSCLVRLLIECANAGCLSASSISSLLLGLLRSSVSAGLKSGEFGMYLVLSSIPWFSPDLALNNADVALLIDSAIADASALVSASDYQVRRDLISPIPGTPDRLESAIAAVQSMRTDGWESQVLVRPYLMEGIVDKLSVPSAEFIHSVPTDDASLFESVATGKRFVPAVFTRTANESESAEGALSVSDRWILEELMDNTIDLFYQSVGECAKSLLRIPVIHPQFESTLVDVIVSRSLLPTRLVARAFFHSLLHRCVVLQESVKPHFESCLVSLSQQSLSPDSEFALADLMCFVFSNNIKLDRIEEVTSSVVAKFLAMSLRLNFVNTVQAKLPMSLHGLIPAEPASGCGFNQSISESDQEEYRKVKEVVRIKDGSEVEAVDLLAQISGNAFKFFVHALIENGSRTVTHFTRLIDLYRGILQRAQPEEREQVLLDAVFEFWGNNDFRLEKTVEILLREGFVTPMGVVGRIPMDEPKLVTYNLVDVVVGGLVARRKKVAAELAESEGVMDKQEQLESQLGLIDTDLTSVVSELLAKSSHPLQKWIVKKYHSVVNAGQVGHELLGLF